MRTSRGRGARGVGAPRQLREQPPEQRVLGGLDEVQIETGVERPLPILRLAVPGERDEPHVARDRARAQAPRQLVSIHSGQPEVDEADVVAPREREAQAVRRVGRLVYEVTLRLEEGA